MSLPVVEPLPRISLPGRRPADPPQATIAVDPRCPDLRGVIASSLFRPYMRLRRCGLPWPFQFRPPRLILTVDVFKSLECRMLGHDAEYD